MSNGIVYTSGPLPKDRRPSQQFLAFGASGSPAPIAESRVAVFNTSPNFYLKLVLVQMHVFILSMAHQMNVSVTGPFNLTASVLTFDIVPRPGLVITIPKNSPQVKVDALVSAGFVQQTNNRYQYYRGPPTPAALETAVKQGVVTDAFAPMNNVSVNGLLAYQIITRLLAYAFSVIHKAMNEGQASSRTSESNADEPETLQWIYLDEVNENVKVTPFDWSHRITDINLDDLPEKGYFFPYFDGLLLPDRAKTLTIVSRFFALLFGSRARIVETTRTLTSGWLSLNDTPAGRAISHMAYCLEISADHGICVRPVYLNDEYCGCVFDTDNCGVIFGNTFVKPGLKAELRAGIEKMQTHDAALRSLCDLFTDMQWLKEGETRPTIPESITCPRDIHHILRLKKVGSDDQKKISETVRKLRFSQTLWDVTNSKHVMRAISMITRGEFPDKEVPINMLIDALWTRDPIYSVLAAFNVRAPSLRGNDTQLSRRIHPDMYKIQKPGSLSGIPIFAKSYNQALEDWQGVLKESQVWFGHKGPDKQNRLRIKDLKLSIPFDSEEGKAVMGYLSVLSKKRGREETDEGEPREPTEEELKREAERKRKRIEGVYLTGFAPTDGGMSVDEPDPFA